jgi:CDP-paratose 2-epimerase
MSLAVITGANGLIGSEAARYFGALGWDILGIDNNMREVFFGATGSTTWNRRELAAELGRGYRHRAVDVRDHGGIHTIFRSLGRGVDLVLHAAAQPSHDWSAEHPITDFAINATGTLNLLEAVRIYCPAAPFVFMSTNKVYGDTPNRLPLVELETRFELPKSHRFYSGIDETMSVDGSLHSVFGVSKLAADVMVQEYGRYFGLNTVCLRGGTLTGPKHSAAELHGFLAYVMRCAMSGTPYTIFGYGGKQVRDAIHSKDVIRAVHRFQAEPRQAAVYNLGGGRASNVSVLEAIAVAEEIAGRPMSVEYSQTSRVGDHIWWVGDNTLFETHYPGWEVEIGIREIMEETYEQNRDRWAPEEQRRGMVAR